MDRAGSSTSPSRSNPSPSSTRSSTAAATATATHNLVRSTPLSKSRSLSSIDQLDSNRRVTRSSVAKAAPATPHKTSTTSKSSTPSTTQQSHRRQSRSTSSRSSFEQASEPHATGSSAASSQRDFSPFSAPATPATAFSTSTNVSSAARSSGNRSREEEKSAEKGQTSAPVSDSHQTPSRAPGTSKRGKGKARELQADNQKTSPKKPRAGQSSEQRQSSSTKIETSPSKGKKRAVEPQSSSADSQEPGPTASSQPSKRQRRSSSGSYNLRPRTSVSSLSTALSAGSTQRSKMAPRKTSNASQQMSAGADSTAPKGKGRAGKRVRSPTKPGPTGSSSHPDCPDDLSDHDMDELEHNAVHEEDDEGDEEEEDEDVEMEDSGDRHDKDHDEHLIDHLNDGEDGQEGEDDEEAEDDPDDDQDENDHQEDDDAFDEDEDDPYAGGHDDGGAGAFGLNLRAMAGYMSGLSTRFRTLLASLRSHSDPTSQLVALQELAELLSVSTEDTLAGYFPTDSYVKELIYIMGGPKPDSGDSGAKIEEVDEDEETAAAIAAASADFEDNGEKMLLACRCLANLMEAMPYSAHSVVTHGAIPVLNEKLMEIQFIDLAEQVLQTLEKISQDYPGSIVKEGGLSAILQYLDFFNIHIQRTAMTAAANCCRKLSTESFNMVKDVMPIIQNVLTYSDQRLVESACKCVVRVVESYKHHPSFLERLLSEELLAGVNSLLLPSSGSSGGSGGSSTTVGAAVYTDMLKALSSAARASAKVAVSLLENNIVETLYHLLTGSPAPPEDASSGSTSLASAQGSPQTGKLELAATLADPSSATAEGIVAVADVAILQNLAQRPKEQVQEALSLVGELLPPLPRDGVFDAKAYSERAYLKRKSKESKSAKLAKDGTTIKAGSSSSSSSSKVQIKSESNAESGTESSRASPEASVSGGADSTPTDVGHSPSSKPERTKSEREIAKESAHAKRVEMLKAHSKLVNRFTQLVLPTLVEVYAASVALHVRSKAISGILKIVSFVEPEPLAKVLDRVPLASFVAAILSSRDHPSLVHGALQLVELLTIKLPDVYKALLRREGVIWEIEDIASKDPKTSMHAGKSKKPDDGTKVKPEPQPLSLPGRGGRTTSAAPPGATDQSPVESGSSMAASSGLARLLAATSGAEGGGGGLPNNVFSSLSGTTNAASSRSTGTLLSDAEDANIWRARVLRDRFAQEAASSEGARKAAKTLDDIKELVSRLSTEAESDEQKAREIIQMLTSLFSAQDEPISSFELLRSGLVEGLYSFATKSSDGVPLEKRRSMLIESLMMADPSNNTAASVLVRRLQELLSRLENVEITTAINSGTEDSRRSPTSMLGRQIRLRLQAEDGAEVPRTCTNVVVTIHAIATFQSLNDYLRPKIAASAALSSSGNGGSSGSMSSRLSGVLAAFAAATGGAGLPDLPGLGESSTGRPSENSGSRVDPSSKSKDSGSDSPSGSKDKKDQEEDKEKGKQRGKESAGPSRRRSSRLSGKGADEGKGQDSAAEEKKDKEEDEEEGRSVDEDDEDEEGDDEEQIEQAAARELLASAGLSAGDESDEALARRLMEGLLQGSGLEEDGYSDEEFDEEILENELPAGPADGQGGNGDADKTINLDVAQDGSKVIAKTPEGTRVASPSHGSPGPSSQRAESSSAPSPSKRSYASALQKKPSDWHLEFSMGDQKLSLGTTIYGAVHNFEMSAARSGGGGGGGAAFGGQQRYIWGNIYTVKYRKVQGPLPTEASNSTPEPPDNSYPTVTLPPSVEPEAPYAKLLQLLAVLHDLNAEWRELCRLEFGRVSTRAPAMSEAAFVNNKLTAKLNRQLEEPMIVASACMPPWSTDLPKVFPFLFPFEVRFAFLQSTAFGYARLITRWQNLHSRNQDNSSSSSMRPDDSFGFLGRLQRQKVRISRANLLQSAFKVFELYGSNSSVLEVEYFEEIGTGLGPTLEFYSLVSKEFARKDLDLWRDNSSDSTGSEYVFSPQGLFPAPISEKEAETAEGKKRIHAFKILGQFVAKALLDSRIIDCNFSPVFMRAVLNEMMPANMNTMTAVDPALAKSLKGLLEMKRDEVGSLGLDFTAPGYPSYELHPDGKDDEVDAANLEQYVTEVLEATLGKGIKPMVRAFRQGFNLIFPISAMSSFTADELVTLFGNTEEDWSEATLMGAIKPDHGLTSESASFKDIISIMSEFDPKERREFLQWMTGSPKLPIGGFAGLHPPLTIVRRAIEPPADPDSFLASCTTCVNFLKLPQYSSREIMRKKLMFAIREGRDSFHLS